MKVSMRNTTKTLAFVACGCSCESYYHFQCGLCRMVSETDPDVFTDLAERGLVEHGKYAPYVLTQAGLYYLKQKARS